MNTTTTTSTGTVRNTFGENRRAEARLVTTALALVCGVGFGCAVVPALEHTITTALLVAGGLVALVLATRAAMRWVRHRREDRADAITAAAWRAQHAPHLLTPAGAAGDGRAA